MVRIIKLPIPDELLWLVDERARAAGLRREAYIPAVLFRDANAKPSISQILSAFHGQVAASGVSDDELDNLFAAARKEVHESLP